MASHDGREGGDGGEGGEAGGGARLLAGVGFPLLGLNGTDDPQERTPTRSHDGGDGGDGVGGGIFDGVRFALVGLNASEEAQARSHLVRGGGVEAAGFGPCDGCTHVIVDKRLHYADPACVAARKNKAKVVTMRWINESLVNGNKASSTDRNSMVTPNKTAATERNAFSTGHKQKSRLGEEFEIPAFSTGCKQKSHLGEEFEFPAIRMSKEKMMNEERQNTTGEPKCKRILNLGGSSDRNPETRTCSKENRMEYDKSICPRSKCKSDLDLCRRSNYIPEVRRDNRKTTVENNKSRGPGSRGVTTHSAESKCKGVVDLCRRSNKVRMDTTVEDDNNRGLGSRGVVSSSSKRINLSDYASEKNLIKLTKVPRQSEIIRLSLPDIKVILLRCFAELAGQHRINKTLNGLLDATSFMITTADNTVSLELNPTQIFAHTDHGADQDYKGFVRMVKRLYHGKPIPLDVSKWLEIIAAGHCFWEAGQIANFMPMMEEAVAFGTFQSIYHSFLEFEAKRNMEFWIMVNSDTMKKYTNWLSKLTKDSLLWETFNWVDHRGKKTFYEQNLKGLLKLVRNCWEHPARLLQSFLVCVLLATFEDLLPDLQKAMSQAGYLKHLKM